jgi:non-ribosomal peptide synthetase component F
MLVQALRPTERDVNRMPLFQMMFALDDNQFMTAQHVADLTLSPLENDESVMLRGYDLYLRLAEECQGLSGALLYSVDRFDAGVIAAIATNFVTLLRTVTEEPETRLSAFKDLIAAQRQQQQQRQERVFESVTLQKLKSVKRQPIRQT